MTPKSPPNIAQDSRREQASTETASSVDVLQAQARALGDPTRWKIFRYVADSDLGADVAEITSHCGFNHNAIRQHLAKLVEAGLVTMSTEKTGGRGRPKLVYRVDPRTESRWGVVGPYERLSVLLTEVIRSGDDPVTVGRRAGRESRPTGYGDDLSVDELLEEMARQGFEPTVREGRAGTEILLQTCPFESAALADPDTVCGLHLGLAQGLTDGSRFGVDELVRFDPRRANCLLKLRAQPKEDTP